MNRSIVIVLVTVGLMIFTGCGEKEEEASTLDAESVTAVSFNTADSPTVEFTVPDMMCPDSCAVKTKEILAEQPGAKDVYVDFETKTATVAIEKGEFDAEKALAALTDHGFDHSTLKNAAPPLSPQLNSDDEAAATP